MINFSRRQLAKYAVDEMTNRPPSASLSARLAAALAISGRQKEVELLLFDIDQELEERGLLARVQVTSAYPLAEQLKSELAKQLKKMADVEEIVLTQRVDKSLIGGLKVETAGRSWDRTLKRILTNIREAD